MPLPKPRPNETQQAFISRCMVDPNIRKENDTQDQRLAVCYNQWYNK